MQRIVKNIVSHLFLLSGLIACGCHEEQTAVSCHEHPLLARPQPLAMALVPLEGTNRLDLEIRQAQQAIRQGKNSETALERLGWLYVRKARESFDPSFYHLAEQCALAMDLQATNQAASLLLRGHALQNLHHFKEAEPMARALVAQRGRPFDHGLLGDVLMEQGNLTEALKEYQTMIDLRPDLRSYSRGAHLRWLKGDLEGATDLMSMAVSAASPRDAESAAWVYTRLGFFRFQCGSFETALQSVEEALQYQPNYPPALLLRGKILLAQGQTAESVTVLRLAAQLNPLPEYLWALCDVLLEAKATPEAAKVEAELLRRGEALDPRTFALFLATRGLQPERAVRLAHAELKTRADVFTHDALAWAEAAAGDWESAAVEMRLALAEGTRDPRLFLHAAIISARSSQPEHAHWLQETFSRKFGLLPSEQAWLNREQHVAAELKF